MDWLDWLFAQIYRRRAGGGQLHTYDVTTDELK